MALFFFFLTCLKDALQSKFMQNMQETDCSILSYILEDTKVKQRKKFKSLMRFIALTSKKNT